MVEGKKMSLTLSKEEEEWNEKKSQVRGKIEAPMGGSRPLSIVSTNPLMKVKDSMTVLHRLPLLVIAF